MRQSVLKLNLINYNKIFKRKTILSEINPTVGKMTMPCEQEKKGKKPEKIKRERGPICDERTNQRLAMCLASEATRPDVGGRKVPVGLG